MILLIDNYDSFSYNLVQVIGEFTQDILVVRNDKITTKEIENMAPEKIFLSPGPGRPKDAGICEEVITKFAGKIPILGVCLGHQAICEVYGMEIVHGEQLMHGKQSQVSIDRKDPIFSGLPESIKVARYHSLVARPDSIPNQLRVIARDQEKGEIMGVRHQEYSLYGLQFHPESILTPEGKQIIGNFLKEGEEVR